MSISEIIQKNKQRWSSYSTKKKISIGAIILAVIILTEISGGVSKAIQLVKSGRFSDFPFKTVEQTANDFFGSPSWSSGVGSDGPTKGLTLVNLKGTATLHGKKADVLLQFIVNENNGSFQAHALEANGIPQPPIMMMGLVTNMCEK